MNHADVMVMQPADTASPEMLADILSQSEALCHAGTFVLHGEHQLVRPSAGLRQLLGLPPDAPDQPLAEVGWIPDNERRLLAHLWRNASVGVSFDIRHGLITQDGRPLQVVHRGLLKSAQGSGSEALGFAVLQDVTEQRSKEQRLQTLAFANETTGLPNRAWLLHRMDIAVSASAWDGRAFTVLSIEVPRISELASSMGFGAADALATTMAARLDGLRRSDEQVAQVGSSEFAMLMRHPRASTREQLEQRAEDVLRKLESPVRMGRMEVFPICRIGASVFPEDGDSAVRMLEAAQVARTDAKASHIAFHTPEATARAQRAMNLEIELREALERGEFRLHYQPQMSLHGGEIVGVEALLRWARPDGLDLSPEEFLPVAERSGLVAPIGDWVIAEACRQAAAWRQAGVPSVRIGVNLSPVQFQVGDVATTLRQCMATTGAQPGDLGLELTESALMHDSERVAQTLRELQALGLEIALDDFGTGFSSLSRLRELPIDVLKVDRAFVADLSASSDSTTLVRSIINLAHGLKVRVVAEGVETEGQLRLLSGAGCDRIQGFLFSKAVPAEQMGEMLMRRDRLPSEWTDAQGRQRTLLLVDDEENILASLRRLFRRDGYRILTANSGAQALELLVNTEVDVIISDQRMPGMAGVDFLRRAKELWPDTIRMTLSGFTDLQSIIDAVNEGAVFKFLTKPWDDQRLREHVSQAFRQKELVNENRRLTQELARASIEQASMNRRMSSLLAQQKDQTELVQASAGGVRDLLEMLPAAVLGLDPEGTLAYVNERACEIFPQAISSLGLVPESEIERVLAALRENRDGGALVSVANQQWRGWLRRIDGDEVERGDLMVLMPCCQRSDA